MDRLKEQIDRRDDGEQQGDEEEDDEGDGVPDAEEGNLDRSHGGGAAIAGRREGLGGVGERAVVFCCLSGWIALCWLLHEFS
jgi:hypothetical protein